MLDSIANIVLYILAGISMCFCPIPIGNGNSTVRRLPYITFAIMALNVVIYFGTLPSMAEQERNWNSTRGELQSFLSNHDALMASPAVRKKLEETGLMSRRSSDSIERLLNQDEHSQKEFENWFETPDGARLLDEFDKKLASFKAAIEATTYYQWGLAPNGNWKFYQLITAAFIHGGISHLFGNLIFFFAVAFSLEDLWGRGLFLIFYLLGAVAACVPDLIHPGQIPSIGASGAISATMGAFLVRLPTAKIKIRWFSIPLALPFLIMGKKPLGVINIPAYVYLPFYFGSQLLYWWFNTRYELISTVGYTAHIAGFVFGAAFAALIRVSGAEEKYINPRIESKVSFSAAPSVTQALEFLDCGQPAIAERKLRAHLAKQTDDLDAILALIQVYQRTVNYTQLNIAYGRLIRYHLTHNDKEAALYAYDGLLSAFPDNRVEVTIPVRDWLVICDYIRESEMNREAAIEYSRLVDAHPDDPMSIRACTQGGEAALAANDNELALRLFEKASGMGPPEGLAARIESGISKCNLRISSRPAWIKQPPRSPDVNRDEAETNRPRG
jgi:membrane associated rhomboid family serine protease